jgi:signal transduction histidine kinase
MAPRAALYGEWARRALAPAIVLLLGAAAVLIFWSRLHTTLLRQQLFDRQREYMLREVQELAGRLLRLQDDERRRIGRELHDSTAQLLAALELNLDRLAANGGQLGPQTLALVKECIELAHQCSAELRTTSYLLHPPLLDELGLLSALRWLADGLRHRSDIHVELQLPQTMERLPLERELALFRVAQEALSNVHRHSRSPTVVIRLLTCSEAVTLEVEDAGRGILDDVSPGATPDVPHSGVGLASMRMRMRQLGGTLTIETSEQGTCVRARLPLPRSSASAPVGAPASGRPPVPARSRAA